MIRMFRPTRLLVTFALLVAIGFAGCGGGSKQIEIPQPPVDDPNFLFGFGTARSVNESFALSQAENVARGEIARAAEAKVKTLVDTVQEQVGTGTDPEFIQYGATVVRTVASNIQREAIIIDRELRQEEDGQFVAYITVRMPTANANKDFVDSAKANQHLYERWRAAELMRTLEQETDALEQEKQKSQEALTSPTRP